MDDVTVSLKTPISTPTPAPTPTPIPTPTPAPVETNLVLNPGLEIGTTTPLNWTLVDQGGNIPILDSVSHSGSRSIEISIPGITNMISGYPQSDLITVEPLTTYTASVWGKTQNTGGSNTPAARVVELDANKNWIRQNNILPVFGRGTNDWAQRTVEFQTAANTRYLYVYANIWNGYGTFWMDDVELRLKDAQTTNTTNGSTIAYFGDVEPSSSSDVKELTKDLNQVITLSPTGKVDAIFFMGDMTTDSGTFQYTLDALSASSLKNTPTYFTIGNHEYNSRSSTFPKIISKTSSAFPLSYFSSDSSKMTFSVNVGNIHVVNMNEYYGSSGGSVPANLQTWIGTDLSGTNNYKIVIGHDPLYPKSPTNSAKHVGDSLDANTAQRDALQALFVSRNVDIFVGGHTHYSSVQTVGGVLHVCSGTIGSGTGQGEDSFATITYASINDAGNLVLTRKHDVSGSWSSPKVETQVVS